MRAAWFLIGLAALVCVCILTYQSFAGDEHCYSEVCIDPPGSIDPDPQPWYPEWDYPYQCHGDTDNDFNGKDKYGSRVYITLSDLTLFSASWGNYHPACDFDRDHDIDCIDECIIMANGGVTDDQFTKCPSRLSFDTVQLLLPAGYTYPIVWQDMNSAYECNCPGSYLLDYSIDNGQSWTAIDVNEVNGLCVYNWIVPDVNSQQCLIRITDAANSDVNEISNVFKIYPCQLITADDRNLDCYITFIDYAMLAGVWLGDMNDVNSLAHSWLDCGNPYDLGCSHIILY